MDEGRGCGDSHHHQLHHCCQHHPSFQFELHLIYICFMKQMSGKAVPVCYHKVICTLNHFNKDFQEQEHLSEATFGMLDFSLTDLFKSMSTVRCQALFYSGLDKQ